MLKNILKVSFVFITLFCFNLDVRAYEFINFENEDRVNSEIDSIYESRKLYDEVFGITDDDDFDLVSSDQYWWPIGSIETIEHNGVLFAPGEPQSLGTSDGFGCHKWRANKEKGEECGWHNGLDINNVKGPDGKSLPPGNINVIAVKDGKVIYPTKFEQTQYLDHTGSAYGNNDGGGLGNYVVIQHSDGTQSVYGHLAFNSITVMAKDEVKQGQVIGKVGHTGSSTGPHLHFGIKVGGKYVDPLDYIDPKNPRPQGSSNFALTSTTLSKSEFVARMNNYCNITKFQGFCNNFAANAEEIYDVSLKNRVNPELVVVYAGAESWWQLDGACKYSNNYWGIRIYNGNSCNSGGVYANLSEGIADFAGVVARYLPGGELDQKVKDTYKAREEAKCKTLGHGLPGTIEGLQSLYSWIGDYRYFPGNSNKGGCYYFDVMYGKSYCQTKPVCTDYNNCPSESRTTICEQNDYSAYRVEKQNAMRYDIFGL